MLTEKEKLIKFLADSGEDQEKYYLDNGPNKREQETHYTDGVSVVRMNVELLDCFLEENEIDEPESKLHLAWKGLSVEDKRRVWIASKFHFGIYGYKEEDAVFWWNKNGNTL